MRRARAVIARVMPGRRRRLPPLPPSFLWGVGTSDHQCEAWDPAHEDVWDVWERTAPHRRPRGLATDFWHRWEEDVQLAHSLGCNTFRFSIAWARVEPEPGRFDPEAFTHYRRIVDRLRSLDMTPIVTLLHFAWPRHLEGAGGLRGPGFPGHFARYAEEAAKRLGPGVGYWITINEPTALPFGFLRPWWQFYDVMPPGTVGISSADQARNTAHVMRNLFLGHTQARAAIRAVHPGARVGANPFVLGLPTWLQKWLDLRTERTRDPEQMVKKEVTRVARRPSAIGRLLEGPRKALAVFSTMFNTNWWYLGMAGRLPEFLCPPECAGQLDFVGFDYYWGIPSVRLKDVMQLYDSMRQRFEKAPVHAGGLYRLLKFYSKMFPGRELIVIENGSVESADGVKRGSYIRRHVRQVQRARASRVPVTGYLCWSITSNREWGLPFTPHSDFGLFHVDLDGDPHLTRVPTVAGGMYKEIIAAGGA